MRANFGQVARPAASWWNITKTLLQTACFWGFFLFVVPSVILYGETILGIRHWHFSHPLAQWLGVILFGLCGGLGLTCGIMMAFYGQGTPLPLDCPRVLVVVGPYRFVRNPMAIAGLGQGVAVGLFTGSPFVVLYALLGGPMWHYLVRPWEEADLEERFGDSYRRYRSAVRCWLPLFPGYR